MAEAKNEILNVHGDTLFGGLSPEISIIVKGTGRESLPLSHMVQIGFGHDRFFLNGDNYLARQEAPIQGSFGYNDLSVLLMGDLAKRYPEFAEKLKQGRLPLDPSYQAPNVGDLLSSSLASEEAKAGQAVFAGIQVQQMNFREFDQRYGATPRLRRLRDFLNSRGFGGESLTLGQIIKVIYSSSIVWVQDLRGRPPDGELVNWERPKETNPPGALNYLETAPKPRISVIGASNLPSRLFTLLMSADVSDQLLFDDIRTEFRKFTDGLDFRVYLEEQEVVEKSELSLVPVSSSQFQNVGIPEPAIFGIQANERRKMVKVASVRMSDQNATWPIRFASAGTIEVLTLLTAILGTTDKILLLDEPAQNMHPDFQERFLRVIGPHSEANRNQTFLITHSPFFIRRNDLQDTWRITRSSRAVGTRVICVLEALSKLDPDSSKKIGQQLDSSDVRSLLFSKGAVFVEGLSDKWAVQELDKKIPRDKAPKLVENEWALVSMETKSNTPTYLKLAELLGLRHVFLLDRDAEPIVRKILTQRGVQEINDTTMRANGFFLLKQDLDSLLGIEGDGKPLKALNKALAMKAEDIPLELSDFMSFLSDAMKE